MYRSVLHGDELKDVSIRTPWRRVERCMETIPTARRWGSTAAKSVLQDFDEIEVD